MEKNKAYENDLKRFKFNQQRNYKQILDNQVNLHKDLNFISSIPKTKNLEDTLEQVSYLI